MLCRVSPPFAHSIPLSSHTPASVFCFSTNPMFVYIGNRFKSRISSQCPTLVSTGISFMFPYLPHKICVFECSPQHLWKAQKLSSGVPEPPRSSPSLTNQSRTRLHHPAPTLTPILFTTTTTALGRGENAHQFEIR